MPDEKYTFLIPIAPESINEVVTYGKGFSELRTLKKIWQDKVVVYIRDAVASGELPQQFTGRIGFFFQFFYGKYRLRDQDNYFLACKGIVDAFVEEKVIDDDNFLLVQQDGIRFHVDAERPRVEITITKYYEEDGIEIDNTQYEQHQNNQPPKLR